MFRGFAIEEGLQFQEAVQCYEKELSNEYRGTSPRRLIPGTQVIQVLHYYFHFVCTLIVLDT